MINQYDRYAPIYDGIMGDRSSWISQVQSLIKTHHPKAKDILELACGTGSIIQGLAKSYTVSGVDSSRQMLKLARKKLPRALLLHQDICKLKFPRKVDVIFLIFDSINHLSNFKSWSSCMRKAAQHLKDDGIFIFDVNTPQKLKAFAREPAYVSKFGRDYAFTHLIERSPERFDWYVTGFRHRSGDVYERIPLKIVESAFKASRIKKELRKHFSEINVSDWEHLEGEPKTHRVWYVCR